MTLRSAFGMMALAALCTHCTATVTTLGQACGGGTGEVGGADGATQLELTTGGASEGNGGTTAVESTTSENVEASTGGTPSFGGTSFGAGGTSAIVASSTAGGTKPTTSRATTGGSTTSTARVVRVQIATVNHLRPSIVLYYDDESTVVVTVGNYTDALDPRICPCKTGERCVSDYIGPNQRAESWWGYCVPATFTCQSSTTNDPVAGISSTGTVCE